MTNVIDQAQAYDALNLQQALEVQAAVAKNTPRLTARGYCHNPDCEEDFGDDETRLFCGPKCAEAHQHYERLLLQVPR